MIDEGNLVEISDQFNETPDYWRNDIDYDNVSVSSVSTYNTVENKNKVKTRYGVSYKNDKSFFKIKGSKNGIPSITGYSTQIYVQVLPYAMQLRDYWKVIIWEDPFIK